MLSRLDCRMSQQQLSFPNLPVPMGMFMNMSHVPPRFFNKQQQQRMGGGSGREGGGGGGGGMLSQGEKWERRKTCGFSANISSLGYGSSLFFPRLLERRSDLPAPVLVSLPGRRLLPDSGRERRCGGRTHDADAAGTLAVAATAAAAAATRAFFTGAPVPLLHEFRLPPPLGLLQYGFI